jgi:two-component system, OmpR family, sensor kinase
VQVYLQLALEAERHLQQLSSGASRGHPVGAAALEAGRRRLTDLLADLRRLTVDELAFVGQSEPAEKEEMARIARFEDLLERAFAVASKAEAEGWSDPLRGSIDGLDRELGALINDVVDDESEEAATADRQAQLLVSHLTLLALGVVAISAVCAVITAVWARRRIQAPIDALIDGTRAIAKGGLDHRVSVSGRDELANLASNFNWMVAELERRSAEIDHARADLERKVEDRTRELQQSNQTLYRVDQARRRMFADISHALRTPLTVIRGEAEVTLRGRDSRLKDYRATLGRIVETAAQLNRLIEDLLLVARSDSASLGADRAEFAIGGLIHEVAEDARALAAPKGICVSCSSPPRELRVRGDADRLRQLLLVLLDNACRYTPAAGQIAIGLECRDAEAVVTVSDSGIGIPADELELVQGRFYRGANAAGMAPQGAGLGLHVARSIVEAHGGELEIESELGLGTRVRVRLPLLNQPEAIDERAAG